MEKVQTSEDLEAAIAELETKWTLDGIILKEHFHQTYNNLRPVNLIKSTFFDIAESKEIKNSLLNSSVGVATGYLAKFLFVGLSGSPMKKVLGTAIMFGIKSMVANNPEVVQSLGQGFINLFKKKSSDKSSSTEDEQIREVFS